MNRLTILLLLLMAVPVPAEMASETLASQLMQASGAEHWPSVERMQFTFRVVIDGVEKVAAKHDWKVTENTDIVTWAGKTVSINLGKSATTDDEKAAFQRWTNDSYWLIAPLKLKDAGVKLTAPTATSLELAFAGVGLTPGDRYLMEIDPATKLLANWVYMPDAVTKKTATWEKYQTSGGLTLSTYHKMGNVEIFIDDLKVTTAGNKSQE